MGQGLGRNSPVQLTLGKDNYCALIERHGQWIRWRTAAKCSCVKMPSMQPDIHCPICGGEGVIYSFQKDQIVFESVLQMNDSGILEVGEDKRDCELVRVYDFDDNTYENAEKLGNYIYLNSGTIRNKGTYFTSVMKKKTVQSVETAVCTKGDDGFYNVPGLKSGKPNIDGVYYTASGDIISIGKLTDSDGNEYTAEEFRLDTFLAKRTEETDESKNELPETLTAENVEYVPPFIFALLNQNLSKADMQAMVDVQGDAVVTYPYECDVANEDVLTVLAGTYTNKEVNARTAFETDTLGVYFVYDIVSCTGIVNGEVFEYKQGRDFILVGTNKIKWLEETAVAYPEVGEGYSITYHVLPTYRVVKQIPQIRTSENQRFPKKAVVKLFTTYSENTGVNRQEIGRSGIAGSF